ncbi:protein JINGUBANG isoform X2 [Arachis stenosperma]|uniref:protein JINGUBANG isoform X2 n=1 Tax=Arachis stenosperma TaxID=217475 RepID=UPI0025ACF945|nr:protein JINGUBANG isoform X2 [Arachis stenosperma]
MEYPRSYSSSSSSSHYFNNHLQEEEERLNSVTSLNYSQSHYHPSTAAYHHCLATLKGHTSSYVSSLTLSGNFLYTGSSDREIRSWDRSLLQSEFDHHSSSAANMVLAGKGAVKSLVVQSDMLFSAHQDHKIRVWKIRSHDNEAHNQKCTRVATLPTLGDRATKVLIPKNHVQIRRHKKSTWVHHVDTVSVLALSGDGALLYSVSWDRTIKIWRIRDFTCLESVNNAHEDAINAMAVSTDGLVYSGSADKKIKVWKRVEEEKKHILVDILEKHNSGINALALSCDETLLYSGACDRSILVWEKRETVEEEEGGGGGYNGKMVVVGKLKGHTKSILCLAVVCDLVCSGSADKTIRVWRKGNNNNEYSCLAVLEGHNGPVKCLTAVVDDGDPCDEGSSFLVYSGSLDCDVKVWKIFVPPL